MKLDSYQTELQALRESAKEFAKKYPALASSLNESSHDPDVERILQGTAYLSAGIHDRLDQGFPEFAQSILSLLAPDYMKEVPATTVVEFKPRNILNGKVTIAKGANIETSRSSRDACRFQTCNSVEVYPLTINGAELEQLGRESSLSITINNTSLAGVDIQTNSLRFHIGGEYSDASHIYYLLSKQLKKVELIKGNQVFRLPEHAIQPLGWSKDFDLLMHDKSSFSAYRRIQEYFVNKHKFLFFDLKGLDIDGALPRAFKLKFYFNTPSDRIRIDRDTFKLFCAPAINLFEQDAEPIPVNQTMSEYQLNPVRNESGNYSIYDVKQLVGQSRQSSKNVEYQRLRSAMSLGGNAAVYDVIQKELDGQTNQMFLRFSYENPEALSDSQVLTPKLICSNGVNTKGLKVGDLSSNTHDVPDAVSVSNITSVSDYFPAITSGDSLWKLLGHLTTNYLSVIDHQNLVNLLNLYNPSNANNQADFTANQKRIDAINSLKSNIKERLFKGSFIRGTEVHVSIDSNSFSSKGDMYLFGELIFYILQQFSDINSFVDLILEDVNNGESLEWQSKLANL